MKYLNVATMVFYRTVTLHIIPFVVLALDVTVFFLIISAVMLMGNVAWLRPFQEAGRPLVDGYTSWVDRWWTRVSHRSLASRGKHIVGLVVLELARLVLVALASLIGSGVA